MGQFCQLAPCWETDQFLGRWVLPFFQPWKFPTWPLTTIGQQRALPHPF